MPMPLVDQRRLYFEDVEVRRSRTKGVTCRVTLKKGDTAWSGEAEGMDSDKAWIELAAQASLVAITQAAGAEPATLAIYGVKLVQAFDREFVFVGTQKDRHSGRKSATSIWIFRR